MAADNNQIKPRESAMAGGNRALLSRISEDIWAVWIGGLLIVAILLIAFISTGQKFMSPVYRWTTTDELFTKIVTLQNLSIIGFIGVVFFLLSSVAVVASGTNIKKYLAGFSIIYLIAILSLVIAGNSTVNYYGIEYVVFALLIGLLISNLVQLPEWLKETARSEFFIKTGLVILGTSILFTDIVKAGLPGILQSVLGSTCSLVLCAMVVTQIESG